MSWKHMVRELRMYRMILVVIGFVSLLTASEPPPGAPISKKEWNVCERVIATKGPELFSRGEVFVEPNLFLPCPISRDPATGALYINLNGRPEAFIGRGASKVVTKSILCGKRAQVVARCEGRIESLEYEAKIFSLLRKARGVARLKSFIDRGNGAGDLILSYYNLGSLIALKKKGTRIPKEDLPAIFCDLLMGLKAVHSAGYIHRDLHMKNTLFHKSEKRIHAVLTDFGLAEKIDEGTGSPCIQEATCPPEILVKPIPSIDRALAEDYALGVILYYTLYQHRPSWCKRIPQTEVSGWPSERKVVLYNTICRGYKKAWQKVYCKKGSPAYIAFRMLNPDPKRRLSVGQALSLMSSRKKAKNFSA